MTQAAKVVVVGGGFAGAYCARELTRRDKGRRLDVTLLSRDNYFVFTPLMVEAGTGNLEPRHCVVPLRSFLDRGAFRMGTVTDVNLESRSLSFHVAATGKTGSLDYDHLVLAPGSVTRLPDVPGLAEFGYTMKSLHDAIKLRDRAVRLLETADQEDDPDRRRALLHFVVVGANYTGVEVAGEYEMFLRRAAKSFPNVRPSEVQVTLVEREERILPAMEKDLAGYAQRELESRGVDVRLKCTVNEICSSSVTLSDKDTLPAETVIWCAGIAPSPLIEKLGLPRANGGYIDCGPDGRVKGHERVWAIGDAAVNPDPEGNPYPPTAQHAVRQGKQLAQNLIRVAAGRDPQSLEYKPLGSLAGLGCRSGVARVKGIKLSGFLAWWLYRTVYLLKMPGLSRKARVAVDWTIDLIFRPDPVQLGVHQDDSG